MNIQGRVATLLTLTSFLGCGGGSASNSGGGSNVPPATSAEVLYAADTNNSIYALTIDQTNGALTQVASVSPGGNSVTNSALAITPAGTYLYAANDVDGEINGYSSNSAGSLSLIPSSPVPILPAFQPPWGSVPAMTIEHQGRFLYAGTLAGGAGAIASFAINSSTGALTATGGPFSTGSFMPAGMAVNPAGTLLYASDQDQSIWGFTINQQDGTLTSIPGSPFLAASQPSGLQIDPSGKFLYVALSNSGAIAGFAINANSGALTPVPGSPFPTASTPFTQTYKLTIHPSGKFLYGFNFNGNTLAAYTIDSNTGALTTISGSPFSINPNAEGDLIADPSGKYLYVTIGFGGPYAFAIFDINATTGAPTPNARSPVAGTQAPWGLAVAKYP